MRVHHYPYFSCISELVHSSFLLPFFRWSCFLVLSLLVGSISFSRDGLAQPSTQRIQKKSTQNNILQVPKKRRYYRRRKSHFRRKRHSMGSDFDCWSYLRRTRQRYCIELVTMGQGDWLFTYFGHNALRVVSRHGRDIAYNFGTFSAAKPIQLLFNYLQFKLQYQLTTVPYRFTRYHYSRVNRTMTARRLLLSPEETRRLVRHLRHHHRKENRKYPYHHYTNNCSTKVRDALRIAIGASFAKRAQVKRGATYRKLVRESMAMNPVVSVLMDFGMGPPADKPLTWWQEMFLPKYLDSYLAQPFWKKERGQPLVGALRVVHKRTKKPPQPFSPAHFVWLLAGLWLLGALFLFNRPALRWFLRISIALFALLGTALLLMLVGTRFPEPPGNANILWFHPLHWLLWWWLGRKRWERATAKRRMLIFWYFAVHTVVACLYLLLKLTPLVPSQENAHYVFFGLFVFGIGAIKLHLSGDWGSAHHVEQTPKAELEDVSTTSAKEKKG